MVLIRQMMESRLIQVYVDNLANDIFEHLHGAASSTESIQMPMLKMDMISINPNEFTYILSNAISNATRNTILEAIIFM